MKRRLYIILAFVVMLFGISSCKSYKDISVTSCNLVSVTPNGFKSISAVIALGIDNPIIGFRIDNLSGTIKFKGEPFLLLSAGDIAIDGRANKVYDINVAGSLVEGFNLLQLLSIAVTRNLDDLTLDMTVRPALKTGIGKTLNFRDVPVKSLIDKI